jgi:hypothetical protein
MSDPKDEQPEFDESDYDGVLGGVVYKGRNCIVIGMKQLEGKKKRRATSLHRHTRTLHRRRRKSLAVHGQRRDHTDRWLRRFPNNHRASPRPH